jgi:signal transduction histidine kinase
MREGMTTQSAETRPRDPMAVPDDDCIIERLEREKTELAAGIAVHLRILTTLLHDLRTPIVAIRGYSKMLLEGRAGPLNQKQQGYLATVAVNARKLIDLANDLDLLRTASPTPFPVFSLDAVLRECADRLRCRSTSIRITVCLSAERMFVAGDEDRIREAVFSLLCHAARLSRAEDELKLELARHSEDQLIARISNAGTKIPPDVLESMFSPKGDLVPESCGPELEPWQARRVLWLNGCTVQAKSRDNSFVFTLVFASARDNSAAGR